MPRTAAFDAHHRRYDAWFARHPAIYHSELLAVRALLPWRGMGLSIGVGTGRFAAPLGVQLGIDAAWKVLGYAATRGVCAVQGLAEALPFSDCSFDYALSVTTMCFVDDASAMIREAHRILKPGGELVIGFIDSTSMLGQHYLAQQDDSVFYRKATFHSAEQMEHLLRDTGFTNPLSVQTLSRPPEEIREVEALRAGRGQGAFVAVKASRP